MYRKYVKRLLDIIISLTALPFFLVLFVIIAPIIRFSDKGTVFYTADRLGYKGIVFKMYKFRSMKMNAPDIRNADGTTFNSENDPRVTKIGAFLRKTSIDETPQLLNVLRGDMSIIGPRPDLPGADKEIYRPGDEVKLLVRPGITGYSQVSYRNSSTLDQRFDGDVFYAKNMSLALDVKILIKSIITVLKHRNIYRND